jgi:hypothetical protein
MAQNAECSRGVAESGDTVLTCNNLGKLLMETARTEEAVALLERAVTGLQRRIADGHPHLEASRSNLEAARKALTERLDRS